MEANGYIFGDGWPCIGVQLGIDIEPSLRANSHSFDGLKGKKPDEKTRA